jgi:hypothetical protein
LACGWGFSGKKRSDTIAAVASDYISRNTFLAQTPSAYPKRSPRRLLTTAISDRRALDGYHEAPVYGHGAPDSADSFGRPAARHWTEALLFHVACANTYFGVRVRSV